MMERTALGSRSNCAVQAWPDQATGAALPKGSSTIQSEAQVSFPRHYHSSLQTPRSHEASHALIIFRVHRILARDPAHNQYP